METPKTTSLSELQKPPAPVMDQPVGFGNTQGFELLQRGAKALATASLVPDSYKNNFGNCLIALEMANRIGASPMMVMQNLYIVHGRPSWSAQFLIATFNSCGRFSALRYEWFGTEGQDDWGCRAWAVEKATGEKLMGAKVDIALAKAEGWTSKNGSKWKTMPQQMLMYRAASWFVRSYAPELSMGLYTKEEADDGFQEQPSNLVVTMSELAPEPQPEPEAPKRTRAKKEDAPVVEPSVVEAPPMVEPQQYITQPDHIQPQLI